MKCTISTTRLIVASVFVAVSASCGQPDWQDQGFCFEDRASGDPVADFDAFVQAAGEVACNYDWYCTRAEEGPPSADWWGHCVAGRRFPFWLRDDSLCFDGCKGAAALRTWSANQAECRELDLGVQYPISPCGQE